MTDEPDAALAAQYEAYPYPKRDPRDEARRLIIGSPGHLREVDHFVFGARRPASAPLRVLVAGGGTGDATIMLAEQLRRAARAGPVTYLDRSEAAMRIARARAAARGLEDAIVWRLGSLLDLAAGDGPFDYVDCCGVLHHLPDPAAGLSALLRVLAPGGGLGLMVYAPYGRTGVYELQDALRWLAPPAEALSARTEVAKRLLRAIPETAWLRRNAVVTDHVAGGDPGIADLLLNPRDRAFTVTALHALLAAQGLRVAAWMEPARYDPATWLPDPRLRARAAALGAVERAALAEAATGNMAVHIVYAVRDADYAGLADVFAPGTVLVARDMPGALIAEQIRPDGTLPVVFDGLRTLVALPPMAGAILRAVDGQRDVAALRATVGGAFDRDFAATFSALERVNKLLVAAPNG